MSLSDEELPFEEAAEAELAAALRQEKADSAGEQPVEEADPVQRLERERDEYLLALQRTQADFENYRKRITRMQDEQSARASSDLVAKLLPVLDTLDLAEAHLNESLEVSEESKALRGGAGDVDGHPGQGRPVAGRPAQRALRSFGARRGRALGRRRRRERRDTGGRSNAFRVPLEGTGAAPRHGPRAGVS